MRKLFAAIILLAFASVVAYGVLPPVKAAVDQVVLKYMGSAFAAVTGSAFWQKYFVPPLNVFLISAIIWFPLGIIFYRWGFVRVRRWGVRDAVKETGLQVPVMTVPSQAAPPTATTRTTEAEKPKEEEK